MKITIVSIISLLFAAAFTTIPDPAFADEDTAIARSASIYVSLLRPRGFTEIRNEDTDVLFESDTTTYNVTLYRGITYAIFACGDHGIKDLDIYLYDEDGYLMAKDSSIDNYPVVTITPGHSGVFRIQVKNYRGVRGWYHMAVAY